VLSAGNALVAGAGAVTTTATTTVGTSCFFRNGSIAIGHRPCPGQSNICCNTTDTCTTNGLCKSHENHWPDTRLTPWINDPVTGAPSYANFTFLYQTSTCTNADYSGCSTQCTNRRSEKYPCSHHHPSSIILCVPIVAHAAATNRLSYVKSSTLSHTDRSFSAHQHRPGIKPMSGAAMTK
jgi:hypothetical protein